MVRKIKQLLYFPIAYYFRFWAQIQLNLWKPRIIAVTGSSGKTTLLHLIESQLGNKAKYSHHANSSYGIPFDILGLTRKDLTPDEWLYLFLLAPFKAFKGAPQERIYVVEADCDRPEEGKFLAGFLKPEVTLWTNSSLTHSQNFDSLVKEKKFLSAEEGIAHEFGYFPQHTKKMIIINGDSKLISKQINRAKAAVEKINIKDLKNYKIYDNRTEFITVDKKYSINFIVPNSVFYSIQMTNLLLKYLDLPFDPTFPNFSLPPGRNSIFKGIKKITIIDSTYNATPDGVKTTLEMFDAYPSKNKWLVLGDMIELGNEEKTEHEKLAKIINSMKLNKIILIGPRVSRYTYPKILQQSQAFDSEAQTRGAQARRDDTEVFKMPKEGLSYIMGNIKGGETILFKGARFLEGIIEHLLSDKNDIKKLVRREKAWQNRRKAWGL